MLFSKFYNAVIGDGRLPHPTYDESRADLRRVRSAQGRTFLGRNWNADRNRYRA
jgi:hypothetical protein